KMIPYLKRFWKENLVVFSLLFLTGLCQTLASVLISSAFNALIERDLQAFSLVLGQIFGIFMLLLFFTHIQINAMSRTQQKIATAIRTDVTKRLEKTSYTTFHDKQVGTYASWLSNDLTTIK